MYNSQRKANRIYAVFFFRFEQAEVQKFKWTCANGLKFPVQARVVAICEWVSVWGFKVVLNNVTVI